MRTFYLDTSAINCLFDDANRSDLTDRLGTHFKVYISVFTVAELAATLDRNRRIGLVTLAKEISGGYHPLAMPGDLLKRSLKATQGWKKEIDASMGPEWGGLWMVLCNPDLIDQKAYSEVICWKEQQEKWYQDMHDRGRPRMQQAIAKLPAKEKNTFGSSFPTLIQGYNQRPDFINNVVCDIVSSLNMILNKERVQRLIDHSEYWRIFLASMVYGMCVRSVQPTHYGKRKNPGSIDTQQAVYLAACDVFVTADEQQRRMIRFMIPFAHKHKRRSVWTYERLTGWIQNVV